MKYGRSLSLCISDVMQHNVKEQDIALIVTSTRANNRESFVSLVDHYCESYWDNNPLWAKDIALRLYDAGKIIQPRLENNNLCQRLEGLQIWANTEKEVYASLTDIRF
jgi:hypothetical protein